ERVRRSETSKTGAATLHLGRLMTAGVSRISRTSTYDRALLRSGVDVAARLDRESTTTRYETGFALIQLTTLKLTGDVIDDRFVADALKVRSYRYLGELDFSPLAAIHGRIAAGYRKLEEGQGVPGYNGSALYVSATTPLSRFGTFMVSSDRDITYSLSL